MKNLPPLPEPTMKEANPYMTCGPLDPHNGKQVLEWYTADQVNAGALVERERCALICREYAKEWAGFPAHEAAAEEIEKRIRSEE